MNEYNQFALERAMATKAVQEIIAPEWVWPELTVAQWTAAISGMEAAAEVAQDAEAQVELARGNLDQAMAALLLKTRQILTMAKVKFKAETNKLRPFAEIKIGNPGRMKTIEVATEVESAWEGVAPTWEPVEAWLLGDFKAEREAAMALFKTEQAKQAIWKDKEEALGILGRALTEKNVGWYAVATALYPEGTQYGDLIRSQIPTTYTPPPPEPAQAVITDAVPSGTDGVQLEYASERATGFNIYFRDAAGAPAFAKIAENIPEATFLHDGLAPATYEYQVSGVNSAGEGGKSETSVVTVTG
jgi:hypothetical protein